MDFTGTVGSNWKTAGVLPMWKWPKCELRIMVRDDGLSCEEKEVSLSFVRWSEIKRIGYVTEDTGLAITDDYFLAVHAQTGLHFISMSVEGALDLANHLEIRFQYTFGPRGNLCNSTQDQSVVIWPSSEAGRDLFDVMIEELGNIVIPVKYCLIDGGFIQTEKRISA